MTPLNYTTKAIAQLMSYPCPGQPGMRIGLRYLAEKLRRAEVFRLDDHGELLDRSKPRPQVPGLIFKPPFPVVALEYTAATKDWGTSEFTASRSTRRISLAWDWENDLPKEFAGLAPNIQTPGVAIASICYFDEPRAWMPIAAATFLPYDGGYHNVPPANAFRDAMIREGRISKTKANDLTFDNRPIPLLPEGLIQMIKDFGIAGMDMRLAADLMDEVNAYTDLCTALACKNVGTRRHPASRALNRARIGSGKPPLKDFHVLELSNGGDMPGSGSGGDGQSPRAHLRRGHIRRLDNERVTWVNATIVRGRGGFVDKQYSMKGARP